MGEATPEEDLREALKTVAVLLKEGGFVFALGGGYASWARGGPEPAHDVDFLIPAADVDRAKTFLTDKDVRVEQPPEDWLFKAYVGDAMVDLIHHLGPHEVDEGLADRATELEVLSVLMPVLGATELLESKLRVLREHECDFGSLLPVARALREQVDWASVRGSCADNPYAGAFLFLAERLGIAPGGGDAAPT